MTNPTRPANFPMNTTNENARLEVLAHLAAKIGLTPTQAIALPSVLTAAAEKIGLSEADMVAVALEHAAPRNALGKCCKRLTANMEAI